MLGPGTPCIVGMQRAWGNRKTTGLGWAAKPWGRCSWFPPPSPGEGSVRLVGGAGPCQGRVEILHGGLWGTVCDDDWGLPDAAVVCRQLGCGAALAATTNAFFGYGTGHILLDNVHCEGGEPRLAACLSLGWGVHNCGHHEDAGALCAGAGLEAGPAGRRGAVRGAGPYSEAGDRKRDLGGDRDVEWLDVSLSSFEKAPKLVFVSQYDSRSAS